MKVKQLLKLLCLIPLKKTSSEIQNRAIAVSICDTPKPFLKACLKGKGERERKKDIIGVPSIDLQFKDLQQGLLIFARSWEFSFGTGLLCFYADFPGSFVH